VTRSIHGCSWCGSWGCEVTTFKSDRHEGREGHEEHEEHEGRPDTCARTLAGRQASANKLRIVGLPFMAFMLFMCFMSKALISTLPIS